MFPAVNKTLTFTIKADGTLSSNQTEHSLMSAIQPTETCSELMSLILSSSDVFSLCGELFFSDTFLTKWGKKINKDQTGQKKTSVLGLLVLIRSRNEPPSCDKDDQSFVPQSVKSGRGWRRAMKRSMDTSYFKLSDKLHWGIKIFKFSPLMSNQTSHLRATVWASYQLMV